MSRSGWHFLRTTPIEVGAQGEIVMPFWRAAVFGLALMAAASITEVAAQTLPVMGYVAAKNANPKRLDVFSQGLAELGYIERTNVRIEYREAVLDAEYHAVVADLVNQKVDLILAANVAATLDAAKATKDLPIGVLAVFDPVGIGVIKNLDPPSKNVTGNTMFASPLNAERLGILNRIVPNLDKVALALNGNNVNNAAQYELLRSE